MTRRRKTTLLLSPIMPNLTGNGLAMRIAMFAEALARDRDVHLVVIPIAGGDVAPSLVAKRLSSLTVIPVQGHQVPDFEALRTIDNAIERLMAFRAFGRPSALGWMGEAVHGGFRETVKRLRPDHVHVSRGNLLALAEHLSPHVRVTVDLDEDDVLSFLRQSDTAQSQGQRLNAEWLKLEALHTQRMLAQHLTNPDHVFASSRLEGQRLEQRYPGSAVAVVHNAVALPPLTDHCDDGATFLFVGAMGHSPNVQAVEYFVNKIMPLIHQEKACRLWVAGAHAPASIMAFGAMPCVEILGFVEDLLPVYARATVALAPIMSGCGTRIKLLEASAHVVPWVSTEIGSEGIEWGVGVGGWNGDGCTVFAQHCLSALHDSAEAQARALCGRAYVEANHRRMDVICHLSMVFKELG